MTEVTVVWAYAPPETRDGLMYSVHCKVRDDRKKVFDAHVPVGEEDAAWAVYNHFETKIEDFPVKVLI